MRSGLYSIVSSGLFGAGLLVAAPTFNNIQTNTSISKRSVRDSGSWNESGGLLETVMPSIHPGTPFTQRMSFIHIPNRQVLYAWPICQSKTFFPSEGSVKKQ